MMKKALLIALACVGFDVSAKDGSDLHNPSLHQIPLACNIAHNANLTNRVNCLTNAHALIKLDINKKLTILGDRDRTHLLNTKALELNLQKNLCSKLRASEVTKLECRIQTDLTLLSYIEMRYEI